MYTTVDNLNERANRIDNQVSENTKIIDFINSPILEYDIDLLMVHPQLLQSAANVVRDVYEVSIWFRTLTNVSDAMIIGYVPDGFEPQERITHVVSSASHIIMVI